VLYPPSLTRHTFLQLAAAGTAFAELTRAAEPPRFATRGVILLPFDLTLSDWPERAAKAGLTTIALHAVRLHGDPSEQINTYGAGLAS
jgi:hypothetical protein